MTKGVLNRALERKECVTLIYLNKEGVISQRVITVLQLKERWFVAYCHSKRQRRVFKYENVLSLNQIKRTVS
ncbi:MULTISPECIES: hypothetical protein [Shouchella]|uniref:WYL domain-containing protein n=2 Tax=Shouchella TaxID=2893057 RepID=A0ABY7WDI5_9BACI|nr:MULTISPECIES: hypothetical protein [Shouchella]MED4128811.1 hypothetical protein [Shouchella miscanthi]WDF05832.1 hypothetical protein PQ477_10465 [Shouchella hunanensis]GAF20407.1 hypothetical protein JCM19047_40 [Bacillus sp. JCM 19047]